MCIDSNAQKNKDSTRLRNLPYHKYKGLQTTYIDLTGYFVIQEASTKSAYSIRLTPTYTYYVAPFLELTGSYGINLEVKNTGSERISKLFNFFSAGVNYYPLKKLNFIYLHSGIQYQNYALQKQTLDLTKAWHLSGKFGAGIRFITKKGLVINYSALIELPFNKKYNYDFVRSLGIGKKIN